MLRSYLRLVLFALGLLVGVQVPGLINDYAQRVQAHLIEARNSLQGFNDTAQKFFNGDLQALVEHYRSSDDPVFRSDADSIGALLTRSQSLDHEWQALQAPWYARDWHVLVGADPQIRQETLQGYTYQILLSPEAIGWGIALAFLLSWVIESLGVIIGWVFTGGRRRPVISRDTR